LFLARRRDRPSLQVSVPPFRAFPWWLRSVPARIQYLDDIEGVLKWAVAFGGTLTRDSSVDVFEGDYCLKMVTAATAASIADARVMLGIVPKSVFAVQLRWHTRNAADTTLRDFAVRIDYFDGAVCHTAMLRFLKNQTTPQNKWQYLDPTSTYQDVPSGSQNIYTAFPAPVHNYLRAVFDFTPTNPVLKELESNDLILKGLNMSGWSGSNAAPPQLNLLIYTETDVAVASTTFADAICLSDQEVV